MATRRSTIRDLNKRSRDIFTTIVDAYVETGEPIGSKTLSQILKSTLSPATLRNVMADLEDAGLLYSPHTSAGRLPTNAGLRIFVDGLLELGNLNNEDKSNLEGRVAGTGRSFEEVLEEATNTLSGLSNCAGIVLAPKIETPLKHIEFFHLNPGRALVVLVTADGIVENRIIEVPRDIPPSAFIEASNFLNSRFVGQTIKDTCDSLLRELEKNRALLDTLTSKVLEAGLATLGGDKKDGTLIVTGHSKLL